jgi:hypothetical protein
MAASALLSEENFLLGPMQMGAKNRHRASGALLLAGLDWMPTMTLEAKADS